MLPNIPLCLETLLTNITLELPQASVSEHVFVEFRTGSELFPTLFTFMISNTTVYQGVCGEVRLLSKFFSTL